MWNKVEYMYKQKKKFKTEDMGISTMILTYS